MRQVAADPVGERQGLVDASADGHEAQVHLRLLELERLGGDAEERAALHAPRRAARQRHVAAPPAGA